VKCAMLLDTCAVIWIAENKALSEPVEKLLDSHLDENKLVYISAFTGWEISMLMARGRLPSLMGPKEWFEKVLSRGCTQLAAVTSDILIDSNQLPGNPPRDPADRIIITTARNMNLKLITRDRSILEYAKTGYVQAMEC